LAERISTYPGAGVVPPPSTGTLTAVPAAPPERPDTAVAQRSPLLLRRINEAMREGRRRQPKPELIHFFCECQREDCYEPVWLTADAYDERCTGLRRPLILPGHELERHEMKRQRASR
jgi:hypothetical protein